jgi:hypothetical protein
MNCSETQQATDHHTRATLRTRRSAALIAVLACAGVTLAARPAAAQATYHYTGHAFNAFSCGPTSDDMGTLVCSTPAPTNTNTSYSGADFVTATLSFTTALPANFTLQDVTGRPGFQLSLNDGLQTVNNTIAVGMIAEVSTDATGQINAWRLVINTGGVNNGGIFTINEASAQDAGTLACCDPTVPGNFGESFSSPGTWSTAAVLCTLQTNKSTYVNGDTLIAQVFRLGNSGTTATPVELKFWLQIPGVAPIPFIRAGADGSLSLPAGVNANVGPLTLFPISAALPRGSYALGCRFVDPVTGQLQSESIAPFTLQ